MPALIVATFRATIVLAIGICYASKSPSPSVKRCFYFTMVIYGCRAGRLCLLISSLCATQQQARLSASLSYDAGDFARGMSRRWKICRSGCKNLTWINPIRHSLLILPSKFYLKDASLGIVQRFVSLLVIAATTFVWRRMRCLDAK
ncbi:hypothetical protein KCP78_02715 [Salmonella enterica subsp. enterica]|nr:hypothetical protein KCP78_02715 [Salmonella enterica subsp. enterica]